MQLLQADRVAEPHTSKLEKNEQGFNDVASLIGSLIADFAKESQEPKVEEDHSQGDYAAFMSESSESRVEKVNEVEELQNTKASLSVSLTKSKEELASAVSSPAGPAKVIRRSCSPSTGSTSSMRPCCTRLRRRLSFVQTTTLMLWVARSPSRHRQATQARMSLVFSCCRLLLLLSLSLLGSLVADLSKKSQEDKVEEAHSQGDYEEFLEESAQSRTEM